MSLSLPCAKLVLRMMDLPAGNTSTTTPTYNAAGWSINARQQSGWININMRDVLGDMYDKYELFNIVCTSITSPVIQSGSMGAAGEDRFCMAYLSGLPFRNQTYDSKIKGSTSQATIGSIAYVTNVGIAYSSQISPTPCTFSKSDGTSDLVITLKKNLDGSAPAQGTLDWNFTFVFSIYGVKDDNISHDNGLGKQSNAFLVNNYHN